MGAHVQCSTGVFSRENDPESVDAVIHGMDLVDETAFEVIFYAPWYERADEIARRIAELGVPVPVVHAEKGIGTSLAAGTESGRRRAVDALLANCRFARTVGAHMMVAHLWGMPYADENFSAVLEGVPRLADVAADAGLELCVETIPCNVGTPCTRVRQVIEREPRLRVALDTEFLAWHDEFDDARRDAGLWDSDVVGHIHIKDFDGSPRGPDGSRRYLQPGEGTLDLAGFVRDAVARGFSGGLSLEASALTADAEVDVGRIDGSLRTLSAWAAAATGADRS